MLFLQHMLTTTHRSKIKCYMKIISGRQKKGFGELDISRPVYFRRRVDGCKSWGDVRHAVSELLSLFGRYGCEITEEFWDEKAGGEAFIDCRFPCKNALYVMDSKLFTNDCWQ